MSSLELLWKKENFNIQEYLSMLEPIVYILIYFWTHFYYNVFLQKNRLFKLKGIFG